jgi:tRNA modification GTPase
MTPTRVAVLTPPGSSAIAVLGIHGPQAWPVVQQLFRSSKGESLTAPPSGFHFGRFGGGQADEVILTAHGPDTFEVHTHGGRQVVEWLIGLLREHDIAEVPAAELSELQHLPSPAGALVPKRAARRRRPRATS